MQREYQHKSAPTSAYLRKYKSLILELYYLPILELQSLDHLTAVVYHRELLSPTIKSNIHRAVQRRSQPCPHLRPLPTMSPSPSFILSILGWNDVIGRQLSLDLLYTFFQNRALTNVFLTKKHTFSCKIWLKILHKLELDKNLVRKCSIYRSGYASDHHSFFETQLFTGWEFSLRILVML